MNEIRVLSRPRRSRSGARSATVRSDRRHAQKSSPTRGIELRTDALGESSRILRVSGEIDLASGDALRAAVLKTLAMGATFLLVDLSDVDFIDVAGLRTVSASAAQCRAAGCVPLLVLRLAGPVQRLHQLLERAGQSGSSPLAGIPVHFVPETR